MALFFVTLLFFLVFMLIMAVGVILSGRTIKGSCGGMNNLLATDEGKKLSEDGNCGLCGASYEEQVQSGCKGE